MSIPLIKVREFGQLLVVRISDAMGGLFTYMSDNSSWEDMVVGGSWFFS